MPFSPNGLCGEQNSEAGLNLCWLLQNDVRNMRCFSHADHLHGVTFSRRSSFSSPPCMTQHKHTGQAEFNATVFACVVSGGAQIMFFVEYGDVEEPCNGALHGRRTGRAALLYR